MDEVSATKELPSQGAFAMTIHGLLNSQGGYTAWNSCRNCSFRIGAK